jgi:hypothetical protein
MVNPHELMLLIILGFIAILLAGCTPTIRVDGRDVPYTEYKLVLEHKYGAAQEVKHEKD